MVPTRVDSTNQKRLPANARTMCGVFHARLSRQGMVKLHACKGSIFVITEAQFATQGQVM